MADGKLAVGASNVRGENHLQDFEPAIPISDYLKMKPTDLQKFGRDEQVTLLASKRVPPKKSTGKRPKKGTKTPKK